MSNEPVCLPDVITRGDGVVVVAET